MIFGGADRYDPAVGRKERSLDIIVEPVKVGEDAASIPENPIDRIAGSGDDQFGYPHPEQGRWGRETPASGRRRNSNFD